MLKIGTIVDGKYKILNEIGHGGMSTVYLAVNEKANKSWAIKEIRRKNNRRFDTMRQSLIAETNLLRRLRHPSLPRIVDVIDNGDDFLIVMDYIDGNTLELIVEEEGAQPQGKVVEWALQLCDVLNYLHSQPIPVIYRDMKPSNIMLKSDGSIMLIDFGAAREYKDACGADTSYLGTKGYAAPEQFGGMGQTDARTDIYCLGMTMYHLLTAHNPSAPPYEMYPITKWRPELSDGLEKIILKCTQKNPDNRYQSIDELAYALKNYTDFEADTQETLKKRLVVFMAAVCAAVVCMAAGTGFNVASKLKLSSNYKAVLEKASGNEADTNTAQRLCLEAIELAPRRAEAYHAFYRLAALDHEFTAEEEKLLLGINTSDGKYLESFAKSSPMEYADFCYEIGTLYWHYLPHAGGQNSKNSALSWFESAARGYEENEQRKAEYDKCLAYIETNGISQKIAAMQIEGNDEGIYRKYWECLAIVKAHDSRKPVNVRVTLDIDSGIVSDIIKYAGYFSGDNVSKAELMDMLGRIEDELSGFGELDEKQQEIADDIEDNLTAARRMIEVCYK